MKTALTMLFLLLLLVSLPLVAKNKPREWQTGRIINYEQFQTARNFGGGHMPGEGAGGAGMGTANPVWATDEHYLVCSVTLDAGDYTYVAQRTLCASVCVCPTLLKNVETKYVIEKDSLVVLDAKGKEFKLNITERQQKKKPLDK